MADGILTPCNVACDSGIVTVNSLSGSTMQCDTWLWGDMPYGIRPNVCHIGILHLVSISTHRPNRHIILHQSAKYYPNRTTSTEKNDVMSIFKMADLDPSWIVDPIMGSLKSPIKLT